MKAMKNGLKAGAALVGLSMVLASCGSTGIAPDGSASLVVRNVRTDLRDQTGASVACDNIFNAPGSTTTTNVATIFSLSGSISSVDVGLRGYSTTQYDGNYNATFTARDIANVSGTGNDFKASFEANSASRYPGDTSGFLPQGVKPQSIIVNPIDETIYIKNVSTQAADKQGSFFSTVTVHTNTGENVNASSFNLVPVAVYSSCTYLSSTSETL